MSDIININFNISVMTTYKIAIPPDLYTLTGFHPRTQPITINNVSYTLKAGFRLDKEEEGIGKLEDVYKNELAIDFTPYQYTDYSIFFYAITGEVVRFGAAPVQVHDHASIMTGGPAYGTFYSGTTPTGGA